MSIPSDTERQLGIAGAVNISILFFITLWRTIRFVQEWKEDYSLFSFKKKMIFHILLLLTSACDLPLYIGFILYGDYRLYLYSFHKVESAFFFAAFSITVYDWGTVLYDIREYQKYPFILRRGVIVLLNIVYMTVSFMNFFICFAGGGSMDAFLDSPEYLVGVFVQITISFVLTCAMLGAGLKLSWRIRGAAGGLDDVSALNRISSRFMAFTFSKQSQHSGVSTHRRTNETNKEFWHALSNLNMVMGTCAACLFLQILLLVLNYALGFYNESGKTVGPLWFYWTAYFWLPLWGPILALLYLSRSHSKDKAKSNGVSGNNSHFGRTLSATGSNTNPLIFDEDDESGTYGRDETNDLSTSLLPHEVLAAAVTRHSNQSAVSGDSTSRQYATSGNPRASDENDGDAIDTRRPSGLNTVDECGSMSSYATNTDAGGGGGGDVYSPDGSFNYRDTMISQQTGVSAMPSEIYYRDVKGGKPGYSIDYSYSHRIEPEELLSPPSVNSRK